MKFNRREFIKIASASVSSLALSGGLFWGLEESMMPLALADGPVVQTPTYCEICFWKCAGWVYQKDGRPWKIVGNDEDQHSYGRMCTRGTGGIGAYLDDNRLKTPLIRTQERGKQIFKEVSWDEALGYIATKMKEIGQKYGPESMALFTHGTGGDYFKTLLNAYGSDSATAPSYAQCRGPREEAFSLTFGESLGSPERTDIENTRCLVLIGCHIGENLHNGQVQEFAKALEKGATVITVDPRFSVAASKSQYWLPIKPSTDIALLLSWIHVLLQEDLYQKEYIQHYASGLDELKKEAQNYTPEWASAITSISSETIRETARVMARNAPAAIVHPSRHVTWYGDDTQRIRAVAILNALLGNWGQKGGFYRPVKPSVPPYPIPEFPPVRRSWRDAFPEGIYPFASLIPASAVRDASLPQGKKPPFYHGWIVYGTNLPLTMPEPEKTYQALQALDLVVAVDILPSEITGWADVVLPECSYLERYDDLRISPGKEAQIALRMPAFEPKHNSKPAWWMVKELSQKMGLERYFPWKNMEEYLDYRLKQVGSSLEEMKTLGVKKFPPSHKLYYEKGEKIKFKTSSGKIELYSHPLKERGFDPLPRYTPHEEAPDGYFRLLYGRAPAHTFGRTVNNPLLNELMSENEIWVHPSVAQEWSLKNGMYVKLKNQDGKISNPVKIKVTERIRPDSVYMVHGFGQTQKQLTRSYLKGADDTSLITRVKVDPIMGGTGFRDNFVTFQKEGV